MTFALQVNGSTVCLLEGELRNKESKLGPGGVFKVITVARAFPKPEPLKLDDRVFLIYLPDAPRTSSRNNAAAEAQRRGEQ